MATAYTFNTVKLEVAATLERGVEITDEIPLDQLPACINKAERRIARDIKLLGMLTPVTSALASGTAVLTKPSRWLRTASINIGTGAGFTARKSLFPRSYEVLRIWFPDDSVTGEPIFYSDYGQNHFLIGPVPDQNYPFELNYYAQPVLLDDGNQTNWLTDYAPHLLIAAACLEFAMFLKADLAPWQADYQAALQAEGNEELKKVADRTSTRQGV